MISGQKPYFMQQVYYYMEATDETLHMTKYVPYCSEVFVLTSLYAAAPIFTRN